MFVSCSVLNQHHPTTYLCARGAEQKWRRLVEEESLVGSETAFWAYDQSLATVTSFRYMGRILTEMNNNWMEVVIKLTEMVSTLEDPGE